MKNKLSVPFAIIMAVVGNAMMNNSKGRVGKVVFRRNKGQTVASELPSSVANPRTEAQQSNRLGFSLLVAFYRSLSGFLKVGFKMTPNPLSAYNGFMKSNDPTAIDYSSPLAPVIDYADLKVAKGTMTATPITSLVADVSDEIITISWDAGLLDSSQAATDIPYALAVNVTTGVIVSFAVGNVVRQDGELELPRDGNFAAGNTVRVYLFFVKANGATVSDSVTSTTIAIA